MRLIGPYRLNAGDIQSASGHISGEEYVNLLVLESFQRLQPLCLRHVAVKFAYL